MHPMEKILILLVACQVIQFSYLVRHVHSMHGSSAAWYAAKLIPLGLCVAWLCFLALRIFNLAPWFVI